MMQHKQIKRLVLVLLLIFWMPCFSWGGGLETHNLGMGFSFENADDERYDVMN